MKKNVLLFVTVVSMCLRTNVEATYDCIKGCACEKTATEAIADCSGHNFTSIPRPDDYHISVLLLQFNQISIIRSNSFDFYTSLKRANLKGNFIHSIQDGAFGELHLSHLEHLDLSYNQLKQVPTTELIKLVSLQTLVLSYNGLRAVPPGIAALDTLKELDLSSNSAIRNIPAGSLPSSLVTLNMKGTKISTFKRASFDKLINLRRLILSENGASGSVIFEPGAFNSLQSLQYMDLSGCFCRRLPQNSFTRLKQLETLLLRSCYLKDIPIFGEIVSNSEKNDTDGEQLNRKRRSIEAGSVNTTTTNQPSLDDVTTTLSTQIRNTTVWFNPKLKVIDMSFNRKICVTATSIKFPPSIININLRSTSVLMVGDEIFSKVPKLKTLNLCRTRLSEITDHAFAGLTSTTEICLSHNPLEKAPVLPSSLTSLNLTNVKIKNLTKNFLAHIPHIKEANLQHGVVTLIEDKTFIAQGELTLLNLTQNRIEIITQKALAMGDYVFNHKTESLELSRENAKISKRSVNAMSQLLELDLSHNSIFSIEGDAFSTHRILKTIRLEGNMLTEITEQTFLGLPKLESLHLENNDIEYIAPHAFRHLNNLEMLHLHSNNLQIIFEEYFSSLENLKELFLQNNAIATFHPTTVPHLTMIDFSYNNLSRIPQINSHDLQEFYGNTNPIEFVEINAFKEMPNLLHLELRHTNLWYIDYKVFQHTPRLRYLDMSYNQILDFIDDQMPNLEQFLMAENKIHKIRTPLSKLVPKLKTLGLALNNISYIDPDVFAHSEDLKELDLSGNSLYCDCKLKPFVNWAIMMLKTSHVEIVHVDEYMCDGPQELYTEFVLHAVEDLNCDVPTPKSYKTGLAIGIAAIITICLALAFGFIFFKRLRSRTWRDRQSRPPLTSASSSDSNTDQSQNNNNTSSWCCIPCKKWLAKDSFRDRMFSSYSRTEEQGLMIAGASSPTESQAPALTIA